MRDSMFRRLGCLYCHQQDATKLEHTVAELSGTMVAECVIARAPWETGVRSVKEPHEDDLQGFD